MVEPVRTDIHRLIEVEDTLLIYTCSCIYTAQRDVKGQARRLESKYQKTIENMHVFKNVFTLRMFTCAGARAMYGGKCIYIQQGKGIH